jgi:hypothetical protein
MHTELVYIPVNFFEDDNFPFSKSLALPGAVYTVLDRLKEFQEILERNAPGHV